ncbi:hypothetical protein [Streptomyces sp. BRB081]|uniref:hypothetical protein n=1 Tax=Streptomyces sp. BRB081 TaxID=2769544 RepID=UPI0018ACC913|nr:hypothetical protein [Streptomyces sp. BRB081]MBL3805593.1 hypothetical protein [Streptomyces sp. BRB081]
MTLPALASLLALATVAGYGLLCALSPFGTCRRCDGHGTRLCVTRTGRIRPGKPCRRCRGRGRRVRLGHRALTTTRTLHRNGTR